MNETVPLRGNLPQALGASLAAGLGVFSSGDAWAQESGSLELSTIEVGAGAGSPSNTLNTGTGLSRLPGRVQDIPQTVQVVPKEVLQQQNVTTLEQALRNVPGITLSSGEGNGGQNGDQFRIRGFQARNDVYVDGLRDFGVYVRDSFNYENVQVIKGPSSEVFGAGTTGGAINTISKRSFIGTSVNADGSLGSGPLGRATFDVNHAINGTTAVRINGMFHNQDIADRDNVFSDRWGMAASLGFGIGTDLSWHLNYFHQNTDRVPDFGVPTVRVPGTDRALPATEFGLRRSTSFVRATDSDNGDIDMLTSVLTWKPASWLTITNDSRLTGFDREFSSTAAICADTAPSTCATSFLRGGNPLVTYSAGGGLSYWQDAWGWQNVTTGVAKFHTGFLRHELIAGLDLFHQEDERINGLVTGTRPNQLIRTPVFANTTGYRITPNSSNRREADGSNLGAFVSDRIWFTDQISILGGVRYDDFRGRVRSTNTTAGSPLLGTFGPWQEANTDFVSPKASIVFEPTRDYTFYASYARSFTPPGLFVTNGTGADVPTSAGGRAFEPERNDLYEAGAKISVLGGRLGLTGAVFRVEKSNSIDVDPVTGLVVTGPQDMGEARRVQGVELGATGKLTEEWAVQFAYAHFDSKVVESQTLAVIGNRAPYVPENAASLWTTYDIRTDIFGVPGKFVVGGGVVWDDGYFPASDNITFIPASFQLDALLAYEHKNVRIALNAYNLTDEVNYSSSFSTRAVPTSGRTFLATVGARF